MIEPAAAPVKAAQRRGKAAGTFLKKLLEYFCFANTGAQQSANWRLRAFRMACSQYHSSELPSRYDGTLGLWFVSAEGSTVQALHRKAVHGSRGWAACPCFFPIFFVDVMILSCVQFLGGVLNQRACYGHLWLQLLMYGPKKLQKCLQFVTLSALKQLRRKVKLGLSCGAWNSILKVSFTSYNRKDVLD